MNIKMVSLLVLTILAVSTVTQVHACSPWDDDVNGLKHRVDVLEGLVNDLMHDNSGCYQKQIKDLQSQINSLKSQIHDLEEMIDALQEQSEDYNEYVIKINIKIAQLQNEYNSIQQLYQTVQNIQNDITNIKTTISNMNVTQVTIINKYYETHNYDTAITNLNTQIIRVTNDINVVQNNTILHDELLNATIIQLQNSFKTLTLKVDSNDLNVLTAISSLRTEVMLQLTTQIQNIDTKYTTIEQKMQADIDLQNKMLYSLANATVRNYDDLNTKISNMQMFMLYEFALIMCLIIALTVISIYFFFKLRAKTVPLSQ